MPEKDSNVYYKMPYVPPELFQHMRQFKPHAYVTDEQLYNLIRDINPNYSLYDTYYRLVNWKSNITLLTERIDRNILDYAKTLNDRTHIEIGSDHATLEVSQPIPDLFYDEIDSTHDIYDTSHVYSFEPVHDAVRYLLDGLVKYFNLMDANPLKPYYASYNPNLEIATINRLPSFKHNINEPFNPSTLKAIKELDETFNLNREYQRYASFRSRIQQFTSKYPSIYARLTSLHTVSFMDDTASLIYDTETVKVPMDYESFLSLSILCYNGVADMSPPTHYYEPKIGVH